MRIKVNGFLFEEGTQVREKGGVQYMQIKRFRESDGKCSCGLRGKDCLPDCNSKNEFFAIVTGVGSMEKEVSLRLLRPVKEIPPRPIASGFFLTGSPAAKRSAERVRLMRRPAVRSTLLPNKDWREREAS